VRHLGATLASVDLPFHNGSLWPAGAPFLLKLHMLHRICGVVVGVIAVFAAVKVFRAANDRPQIRRLALAIPILVFLQIALGVLTIATFRSVPIAVAHFGGAAALWGACFTMWLATSDIDPAQEVERRIAALAVTG
jgi:heme A synthase